MKSRRAGGKSNTHRVLVRKPEGKRTLGRIKFRWEDAIKVDLQVIGGEGMNWIDLARDREQW